MGRGPLTRSLLTALLPSQSPELLAQTMPKIDSADLLFVIGTSLTVQPFARLAALAPALRDADAALLPDFADAPRVNREVAVAVV